MSQPPTRTGKYLVGHRGMFKVRHFFAEDKQWYVGTMLGWQGKMDFAPTHWMGFAGLEASGGSHAERMAVIKSFTRPAPNPMIDSAGRPAYGILQ